MRMIEQRQFKPGLTIGSDLPGVETLGARVARLRKEKGLTQADLAEALGITVASICYWEQDRSRPKPARLNALSHLLGIAVPDLLGQPASAGNSGLRDIIARSRAEIAHAAGTTPSRVRIVIEM